MSSKWNVKKKRPLVLATKQLLDFASSYAPPTKKKQKKQTTANYSKMLVQHSCTSD